MTEKHQLLTDDQFEHKFRTCSLPKPLLTDDAYFRLAYVHITKYGKEKAIYNLQRQLTAYEIKHGNHFRFTDQNITDFILCLDEQLSPELSDDYNAFLRNFPDLKEQCFSLLDEASMIKDNVV